MIANDRFNAEGVAASELDYRAAVQAQRDALSSRERLRLIVLLTLLVGADQALADLHLCLPTIELRYFLLDAPKCRAVSLTPTQLLEMLT